MARTLFRRARRGVFGRDPAAYARARLPYPQVVYEILTDRCGLRPGAAVFEIGPGTGIATRELLRRGAHPLTLVERDWRLAHYLERSLGRRSTRIELRIAPFELVDLPPASFDLGVAATSFHWLPERRALRKIARLLKPGGWWATWNNHHGDPYRPSPFQRAIQPLYREFAPGLRGQGFTRAAAVRDRRDRIRALKSVGQFEQISRQDLHWRVTLDAGRVRALWGTFSEIVTLPPTRRTGFLDGIERIANDKFRGHVSIHMRTPVTTARRT